MGRKRMPGLIARDGVWHIDKRIRGRRLCESTGERDLDKAQEYLIRRLEEARQASVFGVRPPRSFRQAATRFLMENRHLRSIGHYAWALKQFDPFIGDLPIASVHMGTLRPFITARQRQGRKAKTINLALAAVRHILNVAASEWLDEHNLTWLAAPPKIKLLTVTDSAEPYPLSWEEQGRLFQELPAHLARMALFKVNTGCRNREVCGLRWEWEGTKMDAASREQARHLEKLLQRQAALQQQLSSLAIARRLLGLWYTIHIPIGLSLFVAAFIHIVAAIYYATLLR